MLVYVIWWSRNLEVFESKWKSYEEVVEMAGHLLGEFQTCDNIEVIISNPCLVQSTR